MASKARRTRSPHPGVVLLKPRPGSNHPSWRARYLDPDTERDAYVTLEPPAARTLETRRAWAVRKSKALAKRRMDLEAGAARTTGTAIGDALKQYFDDHVKLRAGTLGIYRYTAAKFEAWALRNGVRIADDLTRAKLVAFKAALVKEPLRTSVRGGRRGERSEAPKLRSAVTVNRELRSIGTVLGYLRELDLLPRLSGDDLRSALKKEKGAKDPIEFLHASELRTLFQSALAHDAATFSATRDEHAGVGIPGTTKRYEAIAPFIATALLTGMRFAEVQGLDWSQIDLGVGEIRLSGSETKTKRGRVVVVSEVSPGLVRLLEAMRPKDGQGRVFSTSRETLRAAERRLKRDFGAPAKFGWQALRRTCGTYLTNAPGVFGAASAYRSARQLGHSVEVAERSYVDVVRGIPAEAKTLEAAMQVEGELGQVVEAVSNADTPAGLG